MPILKQSVIDAIRSQVHHQALKRVAARLPDTIDQIGYLLKKMELPQLMFYYSIAMEKTEAEARKLFFESFLTPRDIFVAIGVLQKAVFYFKGRELTQSKTCPRCNKTLADRTTAFNHIVGQHIKLRLYECPFCPSKFPTLEGLKFHMRGCHKDQGEPDFWNFDVEALCFEKTHESIKQKLQKAIDEAKQMNPLPPRTKIFKTERASQTSPTLREDEQHGENAGGQAAAGGNCKQEGESNDRRDQPLEGESEADEAAQSSQDNHQDDDRISNAPSSQRNSSKRRVHFSSKTSMSQDSKSIRKNKKKPIRGILQASNRLSGYFHRHRPSRVSENLAKSRRSSERMHLKPKQEVSSISADFQQLPATLLRTPWLLQDVDGEREAAVRRSV